MAFDPRDDHERALAEALVRAMEPVAAELRLVNAADFIALIHGEKFVNIQDIVTSSVELFFKPGTLSFGWGAQVDVEWDRAPVLSFDMEFRHRSVWLIFKLILRGLQTDVRVEHVSLPEAASTLSRELDMLREAIADARRNSNNDEFIAH